jgi:hypothetical protein
MKATLYFQINVLVYPKLEIQEYNEIEQKNYFIIGNGTLFQMINNHLSIQHTFNKKKQISFQTNVKMKIYPYIVYMSNDYKEENDKIEYYKSSDGNVKKKKITNRTFTINNIIGYHLLKPEFNTALTSTKVLSIIIKEDSSFKNIVINNNIVKLNELTEIQLKKYDSNYIQLYRLEKYKNLLSYFDYIYPEYDNLENLLKYGEEISKDPYEYIKNNMTDCLKMDKLIALLTENPIQWDFTKNEIRYFILTTITFNILNKLLYEKQSQYEIKNKLELEQIKEVNEIEKRFDLLKDLHRSHNSYWERNGKYIECFHVENDKIFLKRVWKKLNNICQSFVEIQNNLKTFGILDINIPVCLNEQDECIQKIFKNNEIPYFRIRGSAGCGKSYTIKKFIKHLIEYSINYLDPISILLCAFMGKTRFLLEKLQEEYNYFNLVKSFTIDKFIQEVKYGKNKEFKTWFKNKMIIIIDECTVVDIFLLKKLLKYVKKNGIMVIFVGDNDQFWSIGPGSPLDIDDSLNEINPECISTLKEVHRFEENSSIDNNLRLIYNRSKDLKNLFKIDEQSIIYNYDEQNPISNYLIEIYNKHPSSEIQVYTSRNTDCYNISKELNSENFTKYFNPFPNIQTLPKLQNTNFFESGKKIMILKNYNLMKQKLFIVPDDIVKKFKNISYSNIEKLFNIEKKLILSKLKETECISYPCTNGQMNTIKQVRIGFTLSKNKETPTGYYFIYTLDNNETLIVGPKCIKSSKIVNGVICTVYKMQGGQIPYSVFIITKENMYMDYSTLLVAISRATKISYIIKPKLNDLNFIEPLQKICLTNKSHRKSYLKELLIQTFKKEIEPQKKRIKK